MKIFFLLCFCAFGFANTAVAQQQTKQGEEILKKLNADEPCIPISEVKNHIGSEVYTCYTIAGYKIINKALRLLYIGRQYPNNIITVILKGEKVNKELALWTEGIGHFTGKAIMYKGKPAIIITNSVQVGTRIQI